MYLATCIAYHRLGDVRLHDYDLLGPIVLIISFVHNGVGDSLALPQEVTLSLSFATGKMLALTP
jgi:hypothetical protein